jgi:anion-transporting  ArsA/GET3 family ATPase
MWRKGLSARLERHLERGEELMDLNRAAFDRNTDAFERMMAALDRFEQRFDKRLEENELFMHEVSRRSEKVVQSLIQGNREFCRQLGAKTDAKTDALLAEMKEVREESRAQREALLVLVDRLPPPEAA